MLQDSEKNKEHTRKSNLHQENFHLLQERTLEENRKKGEVGREDDVGLRKKKISLKSWIVKLTVQAYVAYGKRLSSFPLVSSSPISTASSAIFYASIPLHLNRCEEMRELSSLFDGQFQNL